MLLVFGLGYVGSAVAAAAAAGGLAVRGTTRAQPDAVAIAFEDAAPSIAQATHMLSTVPPDAVGDPVLSRYAAAIAAAPRLRWIGYLSTTGVYGDRNGGWVDEASAPAPISDRSRRRVAAEQQWRGVAARGAFDIFRLAGIYGPGRSLLDDVIAGKARRIIKPGHAFGRIHRDDIVRAVLAAMRQERAPGVRVLNLADDEPAESAAVVAEAARLLGVAPPDAVPFEQALATMSPMARSFWSENRKVASRRTQQMLGLRWLYPGYREGLRAILAEQRRQRPGQ
ncbi:MAG TPA: SDR family NAD(P)-dependent oxidoreductase [Acetobacteraceae bacterium]|nr:SDR family NAD(P)-dependent oxidoreductase [Acetobacteraceae bacterium]